MELSDLLDRVTDEETFLAFAHALLEDRRKNNGSWESGTIEQFLEASIAWAEDTKVGETQGLAASSPWKRAAVFLYCGKIYE